MAVMTFTAVLHEELAIGTIRGILRQAKIEPDQFLNQ
jgi:predicted RNA binding protein YcfA (HicA-like mRNA interferase family)